MAGHSKWSKVKRFKGALDTKRGALFSKLSGEITIAAKTGGGDPDGNARLRSAILSARAQSMPNDNIDRAIKRGTGEGMEAQYFDEIVYEGYAVGGVAVIVEAATNPVEALETLGNVSPDIIITDMQMPKMSGSEFITALKAKPETASIPIVILAGRQSGFSEKEKRANFAIFKDIDIESQLQIALSTALGEHVPQ